MIFLRKYLIVAFLSVIFCMVVFYPISLVALDPSRSVTQYMIQSWNQLDGIPQNTIMSVIQTRNGYIWVGTQEGLARFNGKKFVEFTKGNNPVFVNDYIVTLFEDKNGTLWIGSREGLLEYKNGKFRRYSKKDGLLDDLVRSIGQDNKGIVWVGTESGLFYKGKSKFVKFEKLENERINVIENDHYNGKIFFGTDNGLFFIKNMQLSSVNLGEKFTANIIRDVLVVSEDEIMVATMGSGIIRVRDGVMSNISAEFGLLSKNVFKIIKDRDGNYWTGCDGVGGMNRISGSMVEYLSEKEGLINNSIYDIFEDSEGNLWVATSQGLTKITNGKVKMVTKKEGLLSNYVNPVIEIKDRIYIGTDRGISVMKNNKVKSYNESLFKDCKIFSFYYDKRGSLWIGTYGNGLFREKDGKVEHFTVKDGLSNDTVFSITGDRDGNIWLGTMGGLSSFKNGRFKSYKKEDGLSNLIIYNLMVDSNGFLWICTGGGGVDRFKDGKFRNYSTEEGLSDKFAVSVYEDSDGIIWIGTANGLNVIRNNKIFVVNVKNGLFNGVAFTIVEDPYGTFWMSSNKGIYYIKRDELLNFIDKKIDKVECGVLTRDDGMADSECSGGFSPSGWLTKKGEILIASPKGMVIVEPEKMMDKKKESPVIIDEIIIDGKKVVPKNGLLKMRSDVKKLKIGFSVLSFHSIPKNKVKYFLEGYDIKWEQLDNSREWMAHYTNLSSGKYKFIVKGANGDGKWNESGAYLDIDIVPFFWETLWFRIIMLLFFSLLSYFIISLLKKYITVLAFWKEKHYIGHYKLTDKIGSGGMGSVFKATDIFLKNKLYAIKVLREDFFGNKEQILRLKNEGIIIDRLRHQNIVKIFERGEYSGGIYIVMELLGGQSLSNYIKTEKKLIISEAIEIMFQISDALSYIHSKNITHRDMKPDNIMVERDSTGKTVVKLLDFGLARIDTFTKLTQTGSIMGSIHYLSPEQLTGGKVSDKSDMFSTGIIFYELLKGEKPFNGNTTVEIMQSILTEEPDIKNDPNEGILNELFDIIKKMLSKNPDKRPSAIQLKDTIIKIKKDSSIF